MCAVNRISKNIIIIHRRRLPHYSIVQFIEFEHIQLVFTYYIACDQHHHHRRRRIQTYRDIFSVIYHLQISRSSRSENSYFFRMKRVERLWKMRSRRMNIEHPWSCEEKSSWTKQTYVSIGTSHMIHTYDGCSNFAWTL